MSNRTLRGGGPGPRTLRGAIPATDAVTASRDRRSGTRRPEVYRPSPEELAASTSGVGAVDTEGILLRGADAARARRIDLVGVTDLSDLAAVGPWAEQLDDDREAARNSGFQQGRQEGLAAGLQAARDQIRQNHEELGRTVDSLFGQLRARSEELGAELAGQVTELALGIARAVLDREVVVAEDPGAEAIARCLAMVPDHGCLDVRLSPDDVEALGQIPGLGDRELKVTPDPSLVSGDAVVTVDQVTVDARLSEALRRVEEALR